MPQAPPNPGDIVVTGKRRVSSVAAFPQRPAPVVWQGSVAELPPDIETPPDPCANPETARDWNADAAAAEAMRRMLQAALHDNGEPDFANREYGALICEKADGSLSIGPIKWGDPILDSEGHMTNPGEQPTVPIDPNGCPGGSLPLAMIHSHPGAGENTGLPSVNDSTWVEFINAARGDLHGRIYVVSKGETGEYRIHVYHAKNVSQGAVQGELGPEFNPVGEPCFSNLIT
jgi:hypothetical protein